jgi:hypothetical protein
VRSELDPSKLEHLALFCDALCLFLYALAQITHRIFNSFLHPAEKEEFSTSLLALIFGGYDNLDAALKLRRISTDGPEPDQASIFPEWKRLELLAREMLEAPLQALSSALLAREVSLSQLSGTPISPLASQLVRESPFARKFCILGVEYLSNAARLPPEFQTHFVNAFLHTEIQGV